MKKIIKGIPLFIIIILSSIFIYPSNTHALTEQTSFVNINNTESLEVDDLSFSNILFKDYSSTSTKGFGLTGTVSNSSNDTISYTSIVYYYDSNYNLIAQGSNLGSATSGTSAFNQISNLSILGKHSVDEIYYYRLFINISDSNFSENNIISLTPSKNYQYSSYGYVIDKYDINIVVNENNTFDITETITAYFNIQKHGIIRVIPLKNRITRLDGTTSTNRTQVTNVSVNNEYVASKEDGNYKLRIGSASNTIKGEQTYVIKYTYNLGKDPVIDYDELYYNIIGNDWDTVIGNITFSITMPKQFDSSKLGFSSGTTGSIDNSKVKYSVSENKITGSYNGILAVGQALTIRCELKEGYFTGETISINIMDYIIFLIPILFLGITIFLWYRYGRDDKVVETVEFYPPEGFNSLEVGFLYKGKAVNQDVTSLLIYLANQGYIKISETEEKTLFSKSKGFKITKLKEYDGNNVNEQAFFNGLFLFANNVNEVTSDELYNTFYITMRKILSNINNKENKNSIFEKTASSKKIFITLMVIASYCLITIPPVLLYNEPASLLIAWVFPVISFIPLFKSIFGETQTTVFDIICGLIFVILMGCPVWIGTVLPGLKQEPIYLIGYGLGLSCIIGMEICLKYLPKRTKYGNEMLGKLKGFKSFLETVEKERLEALVVQNPNYFYDILPYTYVLGVSNKWIKKFESISLQAPSWYDSNTTFDMVTFGSFMNSTMTSAQSAMSYSPSSDSSGSSGGGSSGGGSGGGGGSSW